MRGKEDSSSYMFEFTGKDREDEEYEVGPVDTVRRKKYDRLQLSFSGLKFYLLEPEDSSKRDNIYKKVEFSKNQTGNLFQTMRGLLEGETLDDAISRTYDSDGSHIRSKLANFTEDSGELSEEYVKSFELFTEDWEDEILDGLDEEVGEHIEYLITDEDHELELHEIKDIVSETYGWTRRYLEERYEEELGLYDERN